MDIFTTAYIRRVAVPIKPTKFKVKALYKEPATTKLTEDIDHLEDHDQYSIDARQHASNHHDNEHSNEKPTFNDCQGDVQDSVVKNDSDDSSHQIDLFI